MIRLTVIIVLIASCVTLMYVAHRQFNEELIKQQNPIAAIPLDAGVIIESDNIKNVWSQLAETNLIWSKLVEDPNIRQFESTLKRIDSMLSENVFSPFFLLDKKMLISLHAGDNAIETFAVVNTEDEATAKALDLFKKNNYKISDVESQLGKIYELKSKDGGSKYIAYAEPFLMYATSESLINQALLQLESKKSLLLNTAFFRLNSSVSSSSNFHVYLQLKQLERIASPYFNKEFIENWHAGNYFRGWMEFDMLLKPNSLMFSGLSYSDNKGKIDESILHQNVLPVRNEMLLPSRIKNVKRWAISDLSSFINDYSQINEELFLKACNCNARELLEKMIGEEMIYITFDQGINHTKYNALYIEESGGKFLKKMIYKLGSGDSLISKHNGTTIYQMNSNNFTKFLGVELKKEEKYYVLKDNFIVISSLEGLKKLIFQWKREERNLRATNFKNFSNNYLAHSSSVYYFWSNNEFIHEFKSNVKRKYAHIIEDFSSITRDFDGISVQSFSSSSKFNFHSMVISIGKSNKEESNQLWVVEVDSVSRPLELMKNHRTNTLEVLIQDDNHILYLISATGKIKWTKKLEGKIIGKVKQIDVYKNSKWQMLFNTSTHIHLLDINAKEVTGYPIVLKQIANNPVSIFDYENNKDYRYVVSCSDQKLYNYNKEGKPVAGWTYPVTKSSISGELKHLIVGNKDYIFGKDIEGNVYLLNRKGAVRYESNIKCNSYDNDNFSFIKGYDIQNTKLIYADSIGQIVTASFRGVVEKNKLDSSLNNLPYIKFAEVEGKNILNYIVSSGNKLEIFGPDKQLEIFETFDFDILQHFKMTGWTKKFILVSNEKTQEINLFDTELNPIEISPNTGSINTVAGDINNDNLQDIITITNDGRVIAYTISSSN